MRLPCVGLFLMLTLGFCHISYAGTLTIIERESSAANNLFAGSGGATDISNQSDSTTALTGAFSFSDSGSVVITGAEPAANGSASASGSITVADNVVQSAPYSLSVTASRTASGMASYGSGTGIAQSYQNQEMRVRFTVNGDNATYKLTGDFDPGVITTLVGEAHTLSLRRPFTSQTLEIFESAATIDEMGELIAGRTYEFR